MASLFHMTEAAAIGIHGCAMLARQPGRSLSAREIATGLGVSYDHTVQVLHRLRQAGVVKSVRGPAGGFLLTDDAARIPLLAVYEALEGPLEIKHCMFRTEKCATGCPLFGGLADDMNRMAADFLKRNTLADAAGRLENMQ